MTHAQEWAITAEGKVVLSLDARLAAPPAGARVMARGLLLLATEAGERHQFSPVDRKVATQLLRADEVVVTEPPSAGEPRRTTILPTRAPAAQEAPRP